MEQLQVLRPRILGIQPLAHDDHAPRPAATSGPSYQYSRPPTCRPRTFVWQARQFALHRLHGPRRDAVDHAVLLQRAEKLVAIEARVGPQPQAAKCSWAEPGAPRDTWPSSALRQRRLAAGAQLRFQMSRVSPQNPSTAQYDLARGASGCTRNPRLRDCRESRRSTNPDPASPVTRFWAHRLQQFAVHRQDLLAARFVQRRRKRESEACEATARRPKASNRAPGRRADRPLGIAAPGPG